MPAAARPRAADTGIPTQKRCPQGARSPARGKRWRCPTTGLAKAARASPITRIATLMAPSGAPQSFFLARGAFALSASRAAAPCCRCTAVAGTGGGGPGAGTSAATFGGGGGFGTGPVSVVAPCCCCVAVAGAVSVDDAAFGGCSHSFGRAGGGPGAGTSAATFGGGGGFSTGGGIKMVLASLARSVACASSASIDRYDLPVRKASANTGAPASVAASASLRRVGQSLSRASWIARFCGSGAPSAVAFAGGSPEPAAFACSGAVLAAGRAAPTGAAPGNPTGAPMAPGVSMCSARRRAVGGGVGAVMTGGSGAGRRDATAPWAASCCSAASRASCCSMGRRGATTPAGTTCRSTGGTAST